MYYVMRARHPYIRESTDSLIYAYTLNSLVHALCGGCIIQQMQRYRYINFP